MYMPTHVEDIRLFPHIKTTITNQITAHPNHIYTLCGDFNHDIALHGTQNKYTNTPPQDDNIQWKNFTLSLNLECIPTNTTFPRQGGYNYTSTSLVDGFYSPDNNIYFSSTKNKHESKFRPLSSHSPHSHNTLLARTTPPTKTPQVNTRRKPRKIQHRIL